LGDLDAPAWRFLQETPIRHARPWQPGNIALPQHTFQRTQNRACQYLFL